MLHSGACGYVETSLNYDHLHELRAGDSDSGYAMTVVEQIGAVRLETEAPGGYVSRNSGPGWLMVISGKNPFQSWCMAFILVSGAGLFASAPPPDSVNAALPEWAVRAWGFSLAVAALMNLVGAYWRSTPEVGARIEIVSCLIFIPANLVYPLALIGRLFTAPPEQVARLRGSWLIIGIIMVLSLAAVSRIAQLRRSLDEVKNVRRAMGTQ